MAGFEPSGGAGDFGVPSVARRAAATTAARVFIGSPWDSGGDSILDSRAAMRSKAPAQAEQSQQSTMAQPAAFGQVAERGWQEPAARSPQSGQREARQVNEQPSVLPEEPLGDSVSEPRPETPFGSINNSPRLVDQRQTAVPFSVQRLIQKDNGNGVDLYHGAGWKYDLEAQIRGNAGD